MHGDTLEALDTTAMLLELELAEHGEMLATLIRRRSSLEVRHDRGDAAEGLDAMRARITAATAYRRTLLLELAGTYAAMGASDTAE